MSDIVINGTKYSGVDSISVKTAGGGTAKYTEGERPSGTITITENGTHDVTNYSIAEVNVAGSGSGSTDSGEKYLVQVIDYDGTVLKEENLKTGETFTLPYAPTNHERLVFQEWSSPVEINNNKVTVTNSDIIIGAVYTTKSGLSEFDIELTEETGLSVTLKMDGTKNWGDGTTDTSTSHTYVNYGQYTITCDGVMTTFSSSQGVFNQDHVNGNNYCKAVFLGNNITTFTYEMAFMSCFSLKHITLPKTFSELINNSFQNSSIECIIIPKSVTKIQKQSIEDCMSLKHIVLPFGITDIESRFLFDCSSLKNISIPNSVINMGTCFSNCTSLESITIPDSVITIDGYFTTCTSLKRLILSNSLIEFNNTFKNFYLLKSVHLPDNITSIANEMFYSCLYLSNIVVPKNVTSIGTSAFRQCYLLKKITMPESEIIIGNNAFYNCSSLEEIVFNGNVTSIGSMCFYNCFNLKKYDFSKVTSVPTLSTLAFTGINPLCKFYVPDALYDKWIVATNWSAQSSKIYKASEMPTEE